MGVSRALHEAPSLSKSALLLSPCLAWASPDRAWFDEKRVDAEDTTKRDLGITFHDILDQNQKGHAIEVPPALTKQVAHALNYLTDLELRSTWVQSEVPVTVNWELGEAAILVGVVGRNYPKRAGWQNGTADLVCLLQDGSLYVGDWKTGGTDGAEEQLLSLACGLQRAIFPHTKPPVRIACIQVNEEAVWPHERLVPQAELDAHWDAMRFQWEDIGKPNDYVPGIHCTTLYCPHLGYCGAISAGVKQLAKEATAPTSSAGGPVPMTSTYSDKPVSNQEAGETMATVSAAKRQIKYVEAGLKTYIQNGGRVTAGAYEWSDGGNGFRWRKQ